MALQVDPALRFDVNLSIVLTELPLLERPAAAAAAGFDAVELWWPFSSPTPADAELDALERALRDAGTALVGLNFDAGDMSAGSRGLVSVPDQADRFRSNIDVAVGLAGRLGCRTLNALYGNRVDGLDPARQDEVATENLALAARAAGAIGATIVVESLNSHENPAYPLLSAEDALAVIDRVTDGPGAGGGRLAYLADVYHLSRMGHDPIAVLEAHADRIAHVQIADDPGRHEPGTGEMDVTGVFDALVRTGYRGYVGLEYRPSGASAESFAWLPAAQRASGSSERGGRS